MMRGWSGDPGAGMMGECSAGHGMHNMMSGLGLAEALPDLSDEQQAKIEKIRAEARGQHWDLVSKAIAASGKLHDLLAGDEPDRKAVAAAYQALSDIHLQQLESRLEMRAKVNQVLTKEQRARLHRWRRGAFAPWN